MPLTDKECRNAKAGEKNYKLYDSHGLYMIVAPKGGRYWRYKYAYLGKEKKLSFGVYPEVSLAQARAKRDESRKLLSEGVDPSVHKKGIKRDALLNRPVAKVG
jgi:hypothetical protein